MKIRNIGVLATVSALLLGGCGNSGEKLPSESYQTALVVNGQSFTNPGSLCASDSGATWIVIYANRYDTSGGSLNVTATSEALQSVTLALPDVAASWPSTSQSGNNPPIAEVTDNVWTITGEILNADGTPITVTGTIDCMHTSRTNPMEPYKPRPDGTLSN